jgi:endoglycosylceramidase
MSSASTRPRDGALDYVRLVLRTTDDMGAGWIYWSSDPGSWGPYEEDGRIRNLVDVLGASAPKP